MLINSIIYIILSLMFILLSCFIFTNSIEWFGKSLKLGEGIVGSIFAAIGTALPEIIIPVIAILFTSDQKVHDIGVGAIVGAPFMLATLAFSVTGLSIFIYRVLGRRSLSVNVDVAVLSRDLSFFIVIYGIAILSTFIHNYAQIKNLIAILLALSYIIYLNRTLRAKTRSLTELPPLYITKIIKQKDNVFLIFVQLIFALVCLLFCANLFVKHIETISNLLDVSPLILSIIITPIATELPEKLNSIIWTGRNKDTLALGNISGAMVFQSCFPVAFGMLFTSWNLTGITISSGILALCSAILNLSWLKIHKTANPFVLLLSGVFYILFIFFLFF